MQVFILGMHRSGTSMITGLLNQAGLNLGDEGKLAFSTPGQLAAWNAKGLWERWDVMTANQELLETSRASWAQVSKFNPDNFSPVGLVCVSHFLPGGRC